MRSAGLDEHLGELLDTALSLVDAAVIVSDRDSRVTLWNAGAERLFGWAAHEADGQLTRDLIVPSSRLDDAAEIRKALANGREWSGQFLCRRRDGATLPVQVSDVPLFDDRGRLFAVVAVCADATARLSAERDQRALEAVTDASSDAVFTVKSRQISSWSPAARRVLGWSPAEVIGHDIDLLVPPERRGEAKQILAEVQAGRSVRNVRTERLTKGGSHIPVELTVAAIRDESSGQWIALVTMSDRRTRDDVLMAAHVAEARFHALLARSSELVVIVDAEGYVRSTGPSSDELAPTVDRPTNEQLIGDLVHPEDRELVEQAHAYAVSGHEAHPVVVYRRLAPSGDVRWREATLTNMLDDEFIAGIVFNVRDVTEREEALRELRRLARFDDLTGLPNRTHLLELIDRSLSRTSESARCGLIFFDVDDFCDVNDALGHRLGDELLIALAERVRRAVGERAVLTRFGGDQFAVLCHEMAGYAGCLAVAEDVRRAFDAPFLIEGREVFAAVSQGVATGPVPDAATLVSRADTALYRAKKAGRAQTVVFESAHGDQTAHRLQFVGEIRRAIERNEIVPQYQPVVDLKTGKVVAVEALARWWHPELGSIPPDDFIPVAESTGLIGDLGASVLRRACDDAAEWARTGRLLRVAVNASALQLVDPSFHLLVEAVLARSGLDADRLVIEITESAALHDVDVAMATLVALRDRGIGLSLDDFGTGYSPLTFLKRLPINALKIDRSFVDGLGRDESDDRIVTGVVQLGLALGFGLVAEGVETIEQSDRLRSLGCQFGQGYLWSPAVPAAELMTTIDRIESVTLVA